MVSAATPTTVSARFITYACSSTIEVAHDWHFLGHASQRMAFYSFSKLAPELRQQIWNEALPRVLGQTFFYYKTGCWEPQRSPELDENSDPGHDTNILQAFRSELLDPIYFETPLLFVSREARSVAWNWLLKGHINTHLYKSEHDKSVSFASRFDAQRDCLYVGHDALADFLNEPVERGYEPDLLNQIISFRSARVKYLALPITIFENEDAYGIGAILEEFYARLEELWIVIGPPPKRQSLLGLEDDLKRRWEFDPAGDEATCQRVHSTRDDPNQPAVSQMSIQEMQKKIKTDIDEALTRDELRNLVVRPVLAIRR